MKKKADIQQIVCPKCGEDVSGPNLDSVKAAMSRHQKKAHGK